MTNYRHVSLLIRWQLCLKVVEDVNTFGLDEFDKNAVRFAGKYPNPTETKINTTTTTTTKTKPNNLIMYTEDFFIFIYY